MIAWGVTRAEQPFHVRALVCCGVAAFLIGTGLLSHLGWRARNRSRAGDPADRQ